MKWLVRLLVFVPVLGLAALLGWYFVDPANPIQQDLETRWYQLAGDLLYENRETGEAETFFQASLKRNPFSAANALALARIHAEQGDSKLAERYFQKAVSLDQTNSATLAYAKYLTAQENWNEAIKLYRDVLQSPKKKMQLQPEDYEEMTRLLGQLYENASLQMLKSNRPLSRWLQSWAIYYYRYTLQFNPEQTEVRFRLASLYHEQDQNQQALREYCNVVILKPDSYRARYNLGLVLMENGDDQNAYQQLQWALQLANHSAASNSESGEFAMKVQMLRGMMGKHNELSEELTQFLGHQQYHQACFQAPSVIKEAAAKQEQQLEEASEETHLASF